MMKLGSETGSLINHFMSGMKNPEEIIPGTLATILHWSDREPAEVIESFEKGAYRYVVLRNFSYKLISGSCMDDTAEYEYSSNKEEGHKYLIRSKKNSDKWFYVGQSNTGRPVNSSEIKIRFGFADRYYDPSF